MNDQPNHSATPITLEEGVNAMLCNTRQGICQRYHKCEERIRKSPTASVVGALTAGYFLHRLPVRAILVTQVRVLAALTPPALLLFGAAKLYEFLQRQELAKRNEPGDLNI